MTEYVGVLEDPILASEFPGRVPNAYQHSPRFAGEDNTVVDTPSSLDTSPEYWTVLVDTGAKSDFADVEWVGVLGDKFGPNFDFFEDFHVIPRSFDFGNVLTTQTEDIEVYNAFRHSAEMWNAYINHAGSGITLIGMPSLPVSVPRQSGIQMQLEVSPSGPPNVDSTLEFQFDVGDIFVPIKLQRVVLFDVQPELPYTETLQFLTEVIRHKDGSEQRNSLRKSPRQIFEWDVFLEDNRERQRVDSVLFGWQSSVFGIGMWHELTRLSAATTIGTTVLSVKTTDYSDYRVGGLVLIFKDQFTYDVLELLSLTGTTLTLKSGTLNAYGVGVKVMPMRTAVLEGSVTGDRYPVNLQKIQARFRVIDNDVSLADTSAFSTFNSKVLLDDLNGVSRTMPEAYEQDLVVLDNKTGITFQESPWDRNRRGSAKTFLTNTQQGLWNVRRLLHALRGRQVSLYLPTFYHDLTVTDNLVSGNNTINVQNVGYTQFVRQRQPRNVIRIRFVDGTSLIRTITNSAVVDATKETLTLSANWPTGYTVAQVSRIEYLEKVRFDSDSFRIFYELGDRTVKVTAPVKVVLE